MYQHFHHRDHFHHHPHHHGMGRHHHGRGHGHFAGGFMDDMGPGGRGFRGGRKLSSTDLQLVILALLAEEPSHGYELIKTLEERSCGFYSPSPGMIYPALTYLEEAGYTTVEPEGAKKCYLISDEGRRYLDENRDEADAILDGLARMGEKMEHLRRFFREEDAERYFGGARGFAEFNAARRELKMALKAAMRSKAGAASDELDRIVAILRRAAAEIRGGAS